MRAPRATCHAPHATCTGRGEQLASCQARSPGPGQGNSMHSAAVQALAELALTGHGMGLPLATCLHGTERHCSAPHRTAAHCTALQAGAALMLLVLLSCRHLARAKWHLCGLAPAPHRR